MKEWPTAWMLTSIEMHGKLVAGYWRVRCFWWSGIIYIFRVIRQVLTVYDDPLWCNPFELGINSQLQFPKVWLKELEPYLYNFTVI